MGDKVTQVEYLAGMVEALSADLNKLANDYSRLIFNVNRLLLDVCRSHNEVLLRGKFSCPFMQALADEVGFFEEEK